jgi:hypothetical protein
VFDVFKPGSPIRMAYQIAKPLTVGWFEQSVGAALPEAITQQ